MLLLLLSIVVVLGQQRELTPDIPYNPRTRLGLPKVVHEFLETNNWGDFHLVFHMARKYYVVGDSPRRWMDNNQVKPAPFQEGQKNNGIEFLCMHRAMIEYLTQRFGSVPVTNDPDGRKTVGDVLRGWTTDNDVIAGLQKQRGDVNTFRAGLGNVNNFARFATEDDFGNFIQTGMRQDANRKVTSDRTPGSGVHNWLHGQFMDDSSPITVGDPRTNLPNIMFWRIHGWIEAKWKQYEAARPRSAADKALYDQFMTQFRAHMISMSKAPTPVAPPANTGRRPQGLRSRVINTENRLSDDVNDLNGLVDTYVRRDSVFMAGDALRRHLRRVGRAAMGRVPWALVFRIRSRFFRNHVIRCRHLAPGFTAENCPRGRDTDGDANPIEQAGGNYNGNDDDDNNAPRGGRGGAAPARPSPAGRQGRQGRQGRNGGDDSSDRSPWPRVTGRRTRF